MHRQPAGSRRATARARTGRWAEDLVAAHLSAAGWTILARNVRIGRAELDIVAVDPGPPATVVVVEVRANRGSGFGPPEAGVDRRKLRTVYSGALALRASGTLPRGDRPAGRVRVDLVSVEAGPGLGRHAPGVSIRHLREVIG